MKNLSLLILTLTILFSGLGLIALSVIYFDNIIKELEVQNTGFQVLGSQNKLYKVVKVIDGDTIKVKINGKIETVRLIGVDTPEVDSGVTKQECFGNEASKKTKELLENKFVRLEDDPSQDNTDRYSRLLRYVYLEDSKKKHKPNTY